jgi:hypothetical protein
MSKISPYLYTKRGYYVSSPKNHAWKNVPLNSEAESVVEEQELESPLARNKINQKNYQL